jgi:SAM-dependent methyltransferase
VLCLETLDMEAPMNDRRTQTGDAAAWDERYRTADFVWKTEPNRFLPPEVEALRPGRALDLACGEGRNAVWLATQGWEATGVDFSATGLEKAARLAASNRVTVEWVCADVTTWEPSVRFDLVVVFYLQLAAGPRRSAMAAAARSLAPGGTLLVVAHDLTNLTHGVGGPQSPTLLYTPDDVRDDLAASGVSDLVVERAERVDRPVETGTGTAVAVDCLVRAGRPSS